MASELSTALERARQTLIASVWPPDVFAALFDVLAIDTVWQSVQDRFIEAERSSIFLSDEEVRLRIELDQARDSSSSAWAVNELFRKLALAAVSDAQKWDAARTSPDEVPVSGGFPKQIAHLARAIDAEAAGLSLYGKSLLPDRFQEAHDTLRTAKTFMREVHGRVIPVAVKGAYGNSPQRFFDNLLRIPEGTDRFIEYQISSSISFRKPGEPLRIGFIPTVQRKDEVAWGLQGGRFTVGLNSKHENTVVRRVIKGLKWLLEQGADVIVLPELVSSPALRKRVYDWLKDEAPVHPLLVVCGSEAVESQSVTQRTNQTVVMGPSGRTLWIQKKHNQFKLKSADIEKYGLQAALGKPTRQEVGTSVRSQVSICDIPGSGRFCVLICEDFARNKPGQEALRRFEVDMGIIIIMDGPFSETCWRQRNAHLFAQEPGSRIAIGNSRALISRLSKARRPPASVGDVAFYCLQKQCDMKSAWWPNGPVSQATALLIAPEVKV